MTKTTMVAVPLLVGSLVVVVPVAAQADPAAPDFGQHVSTCAQVMRFSADHNPGMHQGVTGWDGLPC